MRWTFSGNATRQAKSLGRSSPLDMAALLGKPARLRGARPPRGHVNRTSMNRAVGQTGLAPYRITLGKKASGELSLWYGPQIDRNSPKRSAFSSRTASTSVDAVVGKIRAGTPIAIAPAGTSEMTKEFGAIVARSPMVTAPIMHEWHPMRTWSPMVAPPGRGPAPMVHTWWIVQSAPI